MSKTNHKKAILVTGGAGYIGSHTVVELIANGYKPIIVDDFSNSDPTVIDRLEDITKQKITYYAQDYRNMQSMRKIMRDHTVTSIIHFAAHKAVNESVEEPLKYYDNNVAGLVSLLKLVEEFKITSFVFSSSCTVYGEPDTLPVTEQSPVKPATSPYGSTKQMSETILRDVSLASSGLRTIALRYFNPIGAHPSSLIGELPLGTPANLLPYLMQVAAGKRPFLQVYGDDYSTPDGTCVRDYIHVVDLAKAHVAALHYLLGEPKARFEVCNVGTGSGYSVLEVIKTFEDATKLSLPYKVLPRRTGDIVATYASTKKAHKLLGWKAELTLRDALLDAWNWQQKLK